MSKLCVVEPSRISRTSRTSGASGVATGKLSSYPIDWGADSICGRGPLNR